MKALYLTLSGLFFSFSALAGPNINVGTVHDYLDGDQSSYLKRVFNGGTHTAFVRITVMEVLFNADGTHVEVPVKSQGNTQVRDGLMASPARLIVPAQGTQATRLLFLGQRDTERYFRVRFVPVVPEKEDEFTLSQEQSDGYKKTLSAGVNILAGYGTFFFVRPENPRFDTQIENTPKQYSLHNNGNTVFVVDEFKDCAANDPENCLAATKNHVRPGRTMRFGKQAGRLYRFVLIEGNARKTMEIKG